VQISASTMDINDSIRSIFGFEAWEGNIDHASSQCSVDLGGELITVDPALDFADLEERAQKGVNGLVTDEYLELSRLSSVLVRHISEVSGPLGLSDLVVVHDALGA